jgi:hypothetical protein
MRAVECVSCSVETIPESFYRLAMLRSRVVILTRRAQSDPSPGHGIRNNRCMRRGHALASRCASNSIPRVYNSLALVVFCADARRSRPARSQPGVSRTMPNPLRERHASLCSCMPHGALVNSRARAPTKPPSLSLSRTSFRRSRPPCPGAAASRALRTRAACRARPAPQTTSGSYSSGRICSAACGSRSLAPALSLPHRPPSLK